MQPSRRTPHNENGSSRDPGCWDRGSRDERRYKRGEEGLPPPARVVHDLEEGEVERQFLLRDPTMRAEPGAQQRPDAFGRVDVDLAEAVAVVIARVLAAGVADGLVDRLPRSGGVGSEHHAAARMSIPSMPARASAGVR